MRSFAVIAGFAVAANAAAAYYPEASTTEVPAYPAETSSAPAYPAYPAESSAPVYEAESSAPAYPAYPVESSKAPEYPAYPVESSSAPAYPVYPVSSAVEYPEYSSAPAYTTTEVVTGVTTVCPEPTTVIYGSKTYVVSTSTTITDDEYEYTTVYEVKPTPYPVKTPANSAYTPSKPSPVAPYPVWSKPSNGTAGYPTGVKPSASATKPSSPEFTGAAGKATAGFLAIAAGAVAAFL